ncbi:MAG: radical SAM protein, partial [Candidatus Omnitrophica bacterium]|nr:radical SAM protein [Candidatus Omnitrophota bacterium]
HISRFHPDYKFYNYAPTDTEVLRKAFKLGRSAGLNYIYLGNVREGNDTYCPNCHKLLIERYFYDIQNFKLKDGFCPFCRRKIDGVFCQAR